MPGFGLFEKDILYLMKNRKCVTEATRKHKTIVDACTVVDIDAKVVPLTEAGLNSIGSCSLIYRLLPIINKCFPKEYDGFIIEGIKVKPIKMKGKNE